MDNRARFWQNEEPSVPPGASGGPSLRERFVNDISKDPAAFLSNTLFVPEIREKDKPGVLAELADVVVARGIVPADRRDEVLAALADREEKMSTGMRCTTRSSDRTGGILSTSPTAGGFRRT